MKLSAILCILAATMAAAAPRNVEFRRQNQPQNNNNSSNNNNQNQNNQDQNNRLSAEEQKYQVSDNNHKIGRSEVLYPRVFGSPPSAPVVPEHIEPESPTIHVPVNEHNVHGPKTPRHEGYKTESDQSEDFRPEAPKPPAQPVNHVPTEQHEPFSYYS
ncbi:hypothetical protein AbraIFM66951_010995 [Aspergillus brasiliensis]|uniref:Uncharacterized protein n=1 Tax=Aspergillus brasiliensis TaxID=319629 RepID=A0A9W6DL32_9EURO|nr:hypothetical protein AbraCBS73388_003856 [Aspergillus brasiliensis]GKZ41714.1 hypothetical protein AbraIFM66951_010995 [Aspergillus brasiliensis]